MGDLLYSLRMHNPSYTKSMEAANEIERLSAELILERKLSKQQDGLHAGIVKAYEHDCAYLRARVAELEAKLKVAEEALLEISQVACSNSPELKISNAALTKIKEAS